MGAVLSIDVYHRRAFLTPFRVRVRVRVRVRYGGIPDIRLDMCLALSCLGLS